MSAKLLGLGVLLVGLSAAGCGKPAAPPKADGPKAAKAPAKGDHGDDGDHGAGPHGGLIVEFGKGHAEFCVDHAKKTATVYLLNEELDKSDPVAATQLLLSVKNPQFQADLVAIPQDGDPKGQSSRFVATHDHFAKEQAFEGTISGELGGKPYVGDFKEEAHQGHKGDPKSAKPVDAHGRAVVAAPVGDESKLYLTPGGLYTDADIKANGATTVSAKYKNLKVAHDFKPVAGDKLCPVTMTKANPELTWVIGGKKYEFCCPPCVEEFVTLAKTKPGEVKPPEAYLKK